MLLWRAEIPTSHLWILRKWRKGIQVQVQEFLAGKSRDFNFSELMAGKLFSCAFHLESESDSLTLIQKNNPFFPAVLEFLIPVPVPKCRKNCETGIAPGITGIVLLVFQVFHIFQGHVNHLPNHAHHLTDQIVK